MQTTRRAAIAAALVAADGSSVSGERLAVALGISRVAVGKHVAALRDLGYEIDAASRSGYRLVSAPDACIPEEVAPRLRDPLWTRCIGGLEVASTNDEAKALAREGADEGTLVVAARQAAGRGRMGRVWESPPGGAYVSFVLRPAAPPAAMTALPLVMAVGAARALEALGAQVRLKWPNDIEIDGRKLAGILVEMAAEADRVEWLVAGCGINVAAAPHERAVALRDAVPGVRVAAVAAAALDGMAAAYGEYTGAGFAGLRRDYEARSSLHGTGVVVSDPSGARVAEGVVTGIAPDGALVVRGPGGDLRIVSGEVTIRR